MHTSERTEGLWTQLLDGHCRIARRGVSNDKSHFLIAESIAAHERENFRLSKPEREIITSAATGLPLKVIAADMKLSASTVAHRLYRALTKLGCESRVELVWLHATLKG